jgi:hypothetical protein
MVEHACALLAFITSNSIVHILIWKLNSEDFGATIAWVCFQIVFYYLILYTPLRYASQSIPKFQEYNLFDRMLSMVHMNRRRRTSLSRRSYIAAEEEESRRMIMTLQHEESCEVFESFLIEHLCVEYLVFLRAVHCYKHQHTILSNSDEQSELENKNLLKKILVNVWNSFIAPGSPATLQLSPATRNLFESLVDCSNLILSRDLLQDVETEAVKQLTTIFKVFKKTKQGHEIVSQFKNLRRKESIGNSGKTDSEGRSSQSSRRGPISHYVLSIQTRAQS